MVYFNCSSNLDDFIVWWLWSKWLRNVLHEVTAVCGGKGGSINSEYRSRVYHWCFMPYWTRFHLYDSCQHYVRRKENKQRDHLQTADSNCNRKTQLLNNISILILVKKNTEIKFELKSLLHIGRGLSLNPFVARDKKKVLLYYVTFKECSREIWKQASLEVIYSRQTIRKINLWIWEVPHEKRSHLPLLSRERNPAGKLMSTNYFFFLIPSMSKIPSNTVTNHHNTWTEIIQILLSQIT